MDYETVKLSEKIVVGLSARTNNHSPEIGRVIGGLWTDFFESGVFAGIKNKVNEKSIGLYSDYEGDMDSDYFITVCCEVSEAADLPAGSVKKIIPAGKYAKFVVKGHMQKAVAEFWEKLWTTPLERSYTGDFEEYQNADADNAEIHIYIALK